MQVVLHKTDSKVKYKNSEEDWFVFMSDSEMRDSTCRWSFKSSGMLRTIDVSKDHIAFISKVRQSKIYHWLALNMKAVRFCETSITGRDGVTSQKTWSLGFQETRIRECVLFYALFRDSAYGDMHPVKEQNTIHTITNNCVVISW
jgi:hypothetical protein